MMRYWAGAVTCGHRSVSRLIGSPAVLGISSVRSEALRPHLSTGLPLAICSVDYLSLCHVSRPQDTRRTRDASRATRGLRTGWIEGMTALIEAAGRQPRYPVAPAVADASGPEALRPRLATGLPKKVARVNRSTSANATVSRCRHLDPVP